MGVLKIFIITIIAFGPPAYYAEDNCELKVEVQVTNTTGGNNDGSAVMNPKSGVAPFKFIFLEKSNGKLLSKDYTQKELKKLKKGNYKCLVVDEKGCSKEVEFEIL